MSDEIFFNSGMAVAKGIDYLSKGERIKSLSKIDNEEKRYQVLLMMQASHIFPFLGDAGHDLLELWVSDKKALGRKGIEEVLKAQLGSERMNMRDRLMGFIGGNRQE